jgi:hypothetical protein
VARSVHGLVFIWGQWHLVEFIQILAVLSFQKLVILDFFHEIVFLGIAKVRVYFSYFGILFTPFSLAKHFQIVHLKRTQAGFFCLFRCGLFIIAKAIIKL